MKHLRKSILTLLALTLFGGAGAWAQTGYNGAALPAGPDMSGSVINVTAANAQYVLDGAYGDITGKTINFTENVTSLLDLARPTKYAGSGTTVSGTTYTRTLSNVTFTANSGVTLAGFYCTAGATNWSVNKDVMYLNNVYNYVTDGNGNYTSIKTVSNVTFDGLTINAPSGTLSAVFAFGKPGYLTMDGITFTNCTITNSNGHGLYFCSLDQDCMQYGAISITNSIIQGTASDRSGVIIEGVGYSNTVITNNYIVGYHNAIQIENPGNGGSQPQSVTITGNFLKSNNKYPVNLYKLTSNMFTFTGNVVVAGASGKHVGHFHGNASGNLWAANGSAPDANGRMTTTLTAPALYGNDNDVTSTSYYSTAVVNTSSDIWVKFDVTGVTLSQTEASLTVGDTVRLTPTLAPEGQTDQTVTWATSDAAVATVADCVVTAVGAGTATITVTATNGTDVTTDDQTATCTVTVSPAPAIELTKAGANQWTLGQAPDYDLELQVEYYEAHALKNIPAGWTVKVNGVPQQTPYQGDSLMITETDTVTLIPDGNRRRVKSVTLEDEAVLVTIDGVTLDITGCTTWFQIIERNTGVIWDEAGLIDCGQGMLSVGGSFVFTTDPYDPAQQSNYHWLQ